MSLRRYAWDTTSPHTHRQTHRPSKTFTVIKGSESIKDSQGNCMRRVMKHEVRKTLCLHLLFFPFPFCALLPETSSSSLSPFPLDSLLFLPCLAPHTSAGTCFHHHGYRQCLLLSWRLGSRLRPYLTRWRWHNPLIIVMGGERFEGKRLCNALNPLIYWWRKKKGTRCMWNYLKSIRR